MHWGGVTDSGALELRRTSAGGVRIGGRFPYGVVTELSKRHREIIAPRAFASRIDAGEDVHLLIHHDYDRPLASRAAGTLDLQDSETALTFEARIAPELARAPYVEDFLAGLEAGLVRGLSPGFRVPSEAGAEEVRSEGDTLVRTVRKAELFELSGVTRPAYSEAQIEARTWQPQAEPQRAKRRDYGWR